MKNLFPGPFHYHHYEAVPTREQESSNENFTPNDVKNPYSWCNVGISVSYFAVGVVSRITQAPVEYYLIDDLNASSSQYSAYKTLHRLPWSVKFIFGMLSDTISINGYRRKPWLSLGWLGFAVVNLILTKMVFPGINTTIFLVVAFTCFLVLADVCTDTLCVERSTFESEEMRGSLQSTGFTFRSFGRVVGAVLGTFLYDNGTSWSFSIGQIFLMDALIPIFCMSWVAWPLLEIAPRIDIPGVRDQLAEVWRVVQLRAVWRPMIFIYLYSALQVPNSAFDNFLVWGLGFTETQLGYLTILNAIVGCMGYIIFKTFLFSTSWRKIYIGTSLISFACSVMQIMLILRVNVALGIPDMAFALGDEAVVSLMEGVHAMPTVIMFVMLCPEGAEGATFALLTTISSMAGTVANDIGSWLTNIWDVSNDSLAGGDFRGMLKLCVLVSCIQLSPLLLIRILPDSRDEHAKEVEGSVSSRLGGLCLAAVIIVSLVFTIGLNFTLLF